MANRMLVNSRLFWRAPLGRLTGRVARQAQIFIFHPGLPGLSAQRGLSRKLSRPALYSLSVDTLLLYQNRNCRGPYLYSIAARSIIYLRLRLVAMGFPSLWWAS